MTAPSRPVLRYFGGKWMTAPWIISHFPAHRVYVEPFGGAASVLMRKPRAHTEVYNDLSSDAVHLFRILRDPETRERLREACALTLFSREEYELAYEPTEEPLERARRMVVRSFMGLGADSVNPLIRTGFRYNTRGAGSSAASDWRNWPTAIAAIGERLRGVIVEHRPAAQVIPQFDGPTTLIYADPPYLPSTRIAYKASRGNYEHEMTEADHVALAEVLHEATGMVVLSGYPSPLYEELYADWERREKPANTNYGTSRTEVLWLNPACAGALTEERHQHPLDLSPAVGS
jgi:DNA adenine methylase